MRKIFTIALMAVFGASLSVWAQESTSTPEGVRKEYSKTFSGCIFMGNLDEFEGREKSATIIWGEDNQVYFPDIISLQSMGSVAKGVLEGDVITLEVPQLVHHQVEDYGYFVIELDYNLVLLKRGDGSGREAYVPVTDKGSVTFTVQSDGSVVLDDLGEGYALGLTQNNGYGEEWYGAAEYSMCYVPKNEEPFNPAKLDKTPYSYITNGSVGQNEDEPDFGYKVKVAFNGNDVYFFNLCPEYPDWWFKGRLDGTQVIVENNQLMGSHAGIYDATLVFGQDDDPFGYTLLPADAQFIFNYDSEKKIFTTATPDVVMFVNCIPGELTYFLTKAVDPTFVYQDTAAGTPLTPWGLSFFFDEYGVAPDTQGYLGVNLPIVSTDGILLNRNNMSYTIYLDDEQVVFTTSEYGMAEDSAEVPYLFNGNGISAQKFNTMHQILLKPGGAKKVGVVLKNEYDDTVYLSEMAELEIPYSYVGVKDVEAAQVSDEIFYDLSGRRVTESAKGFVIRHTLLDNGSVRVDKILLK